MKAMILAAGLGTRLRPITYEFPKPMVPVLGRPIMAHAVNLLQAHGFEDVIANLHWFPDTIRDHFGDGSEHGVSLDYSHEEKLLGTAGGVRNVSGFFDDQSFLVISGDALTDIDLREMRAVHQAHDGLATLALRRVRDASEYGVVILDRDDRIQGFQEKPAPGEELSDLANCGIYMFRPEIFDYFPEEPFADWAMDVFPALLDAGVAFYGHEIETYWNDVGNLDEYRQGNFDALTGAVRVQRDEKEADNGVFVGEDTDLSVATSVEAPVLVGAGTTLGDGVQLDGPLVVGKGASIGAGSRLRDSIVWPGAEVPAGSVLIGAVFGPGDVLSRL
jgi:mannose-1-phosphate guanylyltransferase